MPSRNLSGFSKLPLYELLQELEKETGEPFIMWLHRISLAVAPDNNGRQKLILRLGASWRLPSHYEERVETYEPLHNSRTNRRDIYEHRWKELIFVPWSLEVFDKSILSHFVCEPQSTNVPRNLEAKLKEEGVQIHRDDFRSWCVSAGYPLPRFWFPGEVCHSPSIKDEELSLGPDLSPEEIAAQGKKLRWPDEKTAAEILKNFPGTENTALGKLLPAKPGTHIADSSHKKRGQRLREKALKISITI